MNKWLIKIIKFLLNGNKLSLEDRIALTNLILDKQFALPFKGIIEVDTDGSLKINGRQIDMNQARTLRESAKALVDNQILKLVRDQVAFTAVNLGLHKAEKNEHLYFAKSALWWGQEELKLLEALAGTETEELPLR